MIWILEEQCLAEAVEARCVVRVKTTIWNDKRGLHVKKSMVFLRRQCKGYNILDEDVLAVGAGEVLPRILNLDEVEDGIYEVTACNLSRDFETGYIDDYDYRLTAVTALTELLGG